MFLRYKRGATKSTQHTTNFKNICEENEAIKLVQNRCEIRNDSAPESRGSLRVVAHVAQWIERLPPEQKVVGPIPTVGARKEAQSTGVLDHGALVGLAIKSPSAPSAAILL
jgi:hypothetical protein